MAVDWTFWPSDPAWAQAGFWDYRPPWIRPARPTSIRWALRQSAAPSVEPIDLPAAKAHLRVLFNDEDALIQNIITTARDYVERMTGTSLATQTWQLYLDRWPRQDRQEYWPWSAQPGAILLPRFPLQSVTSIQYTDSTGATNTVASTNYVVDAVSRIPRIAPASNMAWPSTSFAPENAVVVTFISGYTSLGVLPPTLRQALLLLIGHWYGNREDTVVGTRLVAISIPKSVDALLGLNAPPMVG
jgi:uncharacterized phiE125 gp8 family phage protein